MRRIDWLKILLIIVVSLGLGGCGELKNKNAEETIVDFVRCLREKGVMLYFDSNCEYCKKQKEIFRSEFGGA